MVEVQHKVYNEEHPGATNRNHKESRLSRSQTVIIGDVYLYIKEVNFLVKLGGTAEVQSFVL